MTTESQNSLRPALLTIALLAASLLAYQVLLTRVCALRLHFHFGFLIISNSLLGIGASGSILALFERRFRLDHDRWIMRFSIAYLLSLPASWAYLLIAQIPDVLRFTDPVSGAILWVPAVQFTSFNLACAVPFFFGGLAVGLILTTNARRVHAVYASDLFGAGIGCLVCPVLLWNVGAGGCFLATLILGMAACAATVRAGVVMRLALLLLASGAAVWMPRFDEQFPVPGKNYLDLTSKQNLQLFGYPLYTRWSPNSRIDVLALPTSGIWQYGFLQGRGSKALSMRLPQQWWVAQDGDAGTMLSDFGGEADKLEVLRHTTYSASFHLKEGRDASVCVIGVGGATDLWAAKIHDVAKIRGIELNAGILEVHHTVAEAFSKPLISDPRVTLVCGEGRNELMRTEERFDVLQLTGIDTWTALNSGAYVLAENYLYTVEACRTMYERLTDDGILQITRMAAGMETIRLMNNLFHALPEAQQASFTRSIAALGTGDGLITVMLKRDGFSSEDAGRLRKFADDAGIAVVYIPDGDLQNKVATTRTKLEKLDAQIAQLQEEGERAKLKSTREALQTKHDVSAFVTTAAKDRFVDSYPFDISATTDDRPYFFSFLRWDDPEKAEEFFHQPVKVVQGNPLFLRNQLFLSSAAAALFILLPLVFRRGTSKRTRRGALRFLLYFGGLGVGFIGIEVSLIQKFTLLLGLPLYSIVVTLCAILVFTGIGSYFSRSLVGADLQRSRWVPVGILALVGVFALLSPVIVDLCIGLPLAARCAVVALITAPIGVLLGVPFAYGVRIVERINPSFVPWAWAVNGCTTVVGSIATVILSMTFGFAAVLVSAGLIYLIAFAAIDTLARSDGSAVTEHSVDDHGEVGGTSNL